jgi:hypothetical protein
MNPRHVFRRRTLERGRQIGLHVRIGIFLNGQGRRGVAQKDQQHTVARAGLRDEAAGIGGDIGKPRAWRIDAQRRSRDGLRGSFDDR